MATVKIDTDVDVGNFEAFMAVFSRYQTAFKEQPGAWAAIADASTKAHESFAAVAGSMAELVAGLDLVTSRTRDLGDQTERAHRRWVGLGQATRGVAGHVKDATESLLKWAGIGGLVAGLAGYGVGHALFDVAHGVAANRSTALGYGTTYGGLQSARTNFARFGDADAALGNIAAAQTDPSKRLGFANLGITNWEGKDSASLLAEVLSKAKEKLDAVPTDQLATYVQNRHLDELLPLDAYQRIKRAPGSEVRDQARRIDSDRRGLDLGADVQKKWQEFSTQLTRAGTQLETVFVDRLVALAPALGKLSDAFAKSAATLMAKDGPLDQWLGELNTGLDWLATHLDDPKIQQDLKDFLDRVGEAVAALWGIGRKALDFLHWLAKLTGTDTPTAAADTSTDAGGVAPLAGGAARHLVPGGDFHGQDPAGGFHGRAALGSRGAVDARGITAVDKTIPPEGRALLDTLASGEAPGYNVLNGGATFSDYSHHPGGRAAGRYQDLPSTWRGIQAATGLKDFSPESQDKGNWWLAQRDYKAHTGRDLLSDLRSKDPNAIRNVGRALHSTWISLNDSFERKYHNYSERVAAGASAPAPTPAAPPLSPNQARGVVGMRASRVTINRNTGGNPHTAAAAAAAPP